MTKLAPQTTLVIADDHPIVRYGLINLLATEMDFKIVATCADGPECIEAIRELRPDIAIVDINMPGKTGLEVLAAAMQDRMPTRIVLLAGAPSDRDVLAAMSGGAAGLLLKEAAADELSACLRSVARGNRWLPAALIEEATTRETGRRDDCSYIEKALTRREREVMQLIGQSLTNRETGRRLRVSEGTVKLHLHSIYNKLGLKNRTALAAIAAKYDLARGHVATDDDTPDNPYFRTLPRAPAHRATPLAGPNDPAGNTAAPGSRRRE